MTKLPLTEEQEKTKKVLGPIMYTGYAIGILLIVLKFAGIAKWNWFIILLPLIIFLGIPLLIGLFFLCISMMVRIKYRDKNGNI